MQLPYKGKMVCAWEGRGSLTGDIYTPGALRPSALLTTHSITSSSPATASSAPPSLSNTFC